MTSADRRVAFFVLSLVGALVLSSATASAICCPITPPDWLLRSVGQTNLVVIGDGPDRERLANAYADSHFAGYRFGDELARYLAGGDVFVFPSTTDTFGLVMLEAMACGLPVAALPVTGPIDVIDDGVTGALEKDLSAACRRALELDRRVCRQHAEMRSWNAAARQFVEHLTLSVPATETADSA